MLPAPATLALLLAAGEPAAGAGGLEAPAAAERGWDLSAEVGGGVDTNPARLANPGSPPEGFATLLARAGGTVEGAGFRLAGRLAAGGRAYPGRPGSNTAAFRLDAGGRLALGGPAWATAELQGSDLRQADGLLDQGSLRGLLSLALDGRGRGAALSAGGSVFAPRAADLLPFRSSGPEAWLRAHADPWPGHALSAGAGVVRSDYPGWSEPRRDQAVVASAEYAHRGRFLAALGCTVSWNASTARGGDYTRVRTTGRAAAFLPLELTLAARASYQWSRYPEPLDLGAQVLLAEGGESQSGVELRLSRPAGAGLEVLLSVARYWSEAVSGGTAPAFSRAVATLGVGWRAASE